MMVLFMVMAYVALGTFMLGVEIGMRGMKRIDSKYGADHTYNAECWCRSPVGHSCVGLSDSQSGDGS